MLLSNIASSTIGGVTSSSGIAISLVTIQPIGTCFPASSGNVNGFVLADFKA